MAVEFNRSSTRRSMTPLCIAVLSLVGLALAPAPASAGVLADVAADCNTYSLEQPFQRWLDDLEYVLAPDGTFERRARGWALTGGARVVPGNESFYVHRRGESKSLSLPPGSSATSPAMCVGISYPTLRTFALNRRGNASLLKVEALFDFVVPAACTTPPLPTDPVGVIEPNGICAITIGVLPGLRVWEPTIPMPIGANLLPLLPGNRTAVAFRFSPQGVVGDWRIDDVYVDPYKTR